MVEVDPICRRAIEFVHTRIRLWPSCICDVGNENSLMSDDNESLQGFKIVSVISEDLRMDVIVDAHKFAFGSLVKSKLESRVG